jgi:hypothetical protein
MTRWEYKYLDLYRFAPQGTTSGSPQTATDVFATFSAEMAKAGAEGWEAVGEVRVAFQPYVGHTGSTDVRVVLLKRPM